MLHQSEELDEATILYIGSRLVFESSIIQRDFQFPLLAKRVNIRNISTLTELLVGEFSHPVFFVRIYGLLPQEWSQVREQLISKNILPVPDTARLPYDLLRIQRVANNIPKILRAPKPI